MDKKAERLRTNKILRNPLPQNNIKQQNIHTKVAAMKRLSVLLYSLLLATAAFAQKTGYMNITTFGILAGTSADKNPAPLSVVMEHNYKFNKTWAPGIILGIEQLNENLMPVALNLKLFLSDKRCRFFVAGLCGYDVSLEKPSFEGIKKATGGFLAGMETGMFIAVNSGSSIVLALGYRYNELNYKLEDWWVGNYERKITLNRFSVRIGIAIY
jgi:hypothetical protein